MSEGGLREFTGVEARERERVREDAADAPRQG